MAKMPRDEAIKTIATITMEIGGDEKFFALLISGHWGFRTYTDLQLCKEYKRLTGRSLYITEGTTRIDNTGIKKTGRKDSGKEADEGRGK